MKISFKFESGLSGQQANFDLVDTILDAMPDLDIRITKTIYSDPPVAVIECKLDDPIQAYHIGQFHAAFILKELERKNPGYMISLDPMAWRAKKQ